MGEICMETVWVRSDGDSVGEICMETVWVRSV